MKRLILVLNPRSSNYERVNREVVEKVRRLKGVSVGRFEIAPKNVDANAKRLAKFLMDGDLVISAGGDGTTSVAVNGILGSEARNVRLGVLGYGNYNDAARSFGELKLDEILRTKPQKVWPLELSIDGKHWRYGMCYFTLGMFAESCAVYDEPKTRKALQKKGRRGMLFNVKTLAKWWFREKKQKFLPEFMLGNSSGEFVPSNGASDYMAVNGASVAKMMKGGKWFKDEQYFLSSFGKLTKFGKLVKFMMRSIMKRVPGIESDYDRLDFVEPANVMIQAEGEYMKFENVRRIEVGKSKKALLVVMK